MSEIIYTIGTGADSMSELRERIEAHAITTIVDVRPPGEISEGDVGTPPHLRLVTAEAGLGYRYVGGRVGEDTAEATVDEIVGLAHHGTVVLLASDPSEGVWHVGAALATRLLERGWRVHHIRDAGEAIPHQREFDL